MDIFESLENLNVSEECFGDIVGLVEEYINEFNMFTVGKVNALRRANADNAIHATKHFNSASADENGAYYPNQEENIKTAADAIRKRDRNEELSNRYVQKQTGKPSATIDGVHKVTKETGDALLKSGGDSSVLKPGLRAAVKEFQKHENKWAQKNPTRKKTGLVFSQDNPVGGSMSKKYKTQSLNIDHVK